MAESKPPANDSDLPESTELAILPYDAHVHMRLEGKALKEHRALSHEVLQHAMPQVAALQVIDNHTCQKSNVPTSSEANHAMRGKGRTTGKYKYCNIENTAPRINLRPL